MKLYHGSDIRIEKIDLNKCKSFKDFGKGFYTTSFSKHAHERAVNVADDNQTKPVITIFELDEAVLTNENLSVKRFLKPSIEWVEFVIQCRDRKLPQPTHSYDIVEGPIANDRMRVQFSLFERGTIDLDTVFKRITYIEDTHQISFHTQEAVKLLKIEPDYPLIMMESTISLLVDYLIEDKAFSMSDAFNIVYNSVTYEKLSDRLTNLYREAPAYIYELLKQELKDADK
jgi:hypothetical protein